MRRSSSIAIKVFSLPKVGCMGVESSVGAKIAVDLFFVRRTDKVETMAVLRQI